MQYHCVAAINNSLSMHINMQYTSSTTQSTAFDNSPMHTTITQGKMVQDVGGGVWLDFEGSIPTCACFHSENVFVTLYVVVEADSFVSGIFHFEARIQYNYRSI